MSRRYPSGYRNVYNFDITKAQNESGYRPLYDIDKAIEDCIETVQRAQPED